MGDKYPYNFKTFLDGLEYMQRSTYRNIFVVILGLFLNQAYAKEVERTIHVMTQIDKNKFFSNTVTFMKFKPNALTLEYSDATGAFLPVTTELYIETDIPTDSALSNFDLYLNQNSMSCSDFDGQVVTLNANHSPQVDIDTQVNVAINSSVSLNFNSTYEDRFKSSTHKFGLHFETPLPTEVRSCQGAIGVNLEFSL